MVDREAAPEIGKQSRPASQIQSLLLYGAIIRILEGKKKQGCRMAEQGCNDCIAVA